MRYAVLLIFAGMLAEGALSRAAEGPAGASEPPLRFRRVYAPADRLKDWPRDNLRYVPVDAAEFERLAASAQARAGEAALPSCPLAEATYRARLEGDTLVEGEALLRFAPLPRSGSRWVLDPWNLPVSEAFWMANPPKPAMLLTGGDGKVALKAEPAGTLRLGWSLRGRRDPGGMLEFEFLLPPCPLTRLLLDLPKDVQPLVESGVASRQEGDPPGRARWTLELGPQAPLYLRVVPRAQLATAKSVDTVRQATLYEISLRGVDVTAQWTLDIRGLPRGQIGLELDPGLRLSGAWLGEVPLRWSAAGAASADQPSQAWAELPEPIRGPNRVLRLAAMGPVVLGRPWRLPEIRPRDFFWQEGTLRVMVLAPLALGQLSADGARQTATGSLAAPRAGESAELQCFGPSAGVRLMLNSTQPQLLWDCGTLVDLGGVELRARVVSQFQVAEGEQFQVAAVVGRRWTVQSVESTPPEALDDWSQEGTTGGTLTVRLARGILPRRPVELRIAAHCLADPKTDAWRSDELIPLRFSGREGQHLLALRPQEGYQLHVAGAEQWVRLESPAEAGPERNLLPDPWPPFVFRYDDRLAGFRVRVEKPKPSYTATIRAEALVEHGRLAETYHIRCTPESASMERVVVRFMPARAVPLRWNMVGEISEVASARVRPPEPGATDSSSETWEVTFRRAQTRPFELRAARSVPFDGPQPVSLAAFPEARSQRGTLAIGASGGAGIRIENHRLLPLPLEPVPVDRTPVWRASFHYDPTSEQRATPGAVVLHPADPNMLPPSAWVWNGHLESRYSASGIGHHLAEFRLENTGRPQLALALPPGLSAEQIQSAWIDGQRIAWTVTTDKSSASIVVNVPLPPARRYPVVALHFVTQLPTLRPWVHLAPPLLQPDVPVLRRTWTLWLPPGFQAFGGVGTLGPTHTLPLVQRLAGPFAQNDPPVGWSGAWWQPIVGSTEQAVSTQCEAFLVRLAKTEEALRKRESAAESHDQPPPSTTWGPLLGDTVEGTAFHLVMDPQGLSAVGLTPQTPVRPPTGASLLARGRALLEQAGLVLVATNDVLLLTGRPQAALFRPHLSPADAASATALGPLAQQIQEAWYSPSESGFLTFPLWRRLSPSAASPWAAWNSAGDGPTDATGWSASHWEVLEDDLRVWIVDQDRMEVARWAALAIFLALVWWGGPGRLGLLVLLVGGLAVLTLAVPELFVPPCSGAFLGASASLVLSLFRRRPPTAKPSAVATGEESPPAPSPVPPSGGSSPRPASSMGLGLFLLVWCTAGAQAQEPPRAPGRASPLPVYQVIIPTEAGQKLPTKYLVPETFYAELQRRAEGPAERLPLWSLSGAVYRGFAAWKAAPEQLAVVDLRAYYDLEVLGRNVRLVLPLGSEWVQPVPAGVLLDGRPATVRSVGEAGLELEIAEPGRYRLEVPLHVAAQSAGGWSGFETRIPPLCTARLEWTIPRDASAIEVPSALGRVTLAPEEGRLLADLGPTPRLAMRWPEGPGRSPGGPLMDVEHLLWFKIQPGSVVLDVTLRCRTLQGRVRCLEVLADPRLRLAPIEGDRSWLAQVETLPGPLQTFRFTLGPTVPDQFEIAVSFLVTDTSGVGQLRLPLITVPAGRTVRRWLAVSVDPGLQYQQSGTQGLQPVAVPTFLAAWGAAKSEPLFVYDLATGEPAWTIATRPVPPRTVAEQTLNITVGRGRAELVLDALLVTQPGPRFQHRLFVPRRVELDRVAWVEQSAEQPLRFARGSHPDEVTVFLPGPATGKSLLRVQGHLAMPESQVLDVPLLRVLAEESKSFILQVFRQPDVRVEPAGVEGLVPIEGPAAEARRLPPGRWVAGWQSNGSPSPHLRLKVAPNDPHLRGEQITLLHNDGQGWIAETEFRLDIQGGLADEFRLEVPPEWPGPYKVEPAMSIKPLEPRGQGRRGLVLRPVAPVEGKFRFRVSGPLVADASTPPAAPSIVLKQAALTRHRLILPLQSQLQALFWETRGLAQAPLPEDFSLPAKSRDSFAAFQVVQEPFRTILRSLGHMSGVSQVLLCDLAVAVQPDGACRGVAVFDVQPAGLADCPLELPEGFALVEVTVEGIPVTPIAQAPGKFILPLGLNLLPQRIEVVFEGRCDLTAAGTTPRCPLPRIGDLPVQTTLWTIAGPRTSALLAGELPELDALQQELLRLKHLTAVAELGAELPDEDAAVIGRWFLPWARRWRAALDQTQRLLALRADDPNTQSLRAELQSLQTRQNRAAERLHATEVLKQVLSETPLATEAADLWVRTFAEQTPVARGVVEGPLSTLAVGFSRQPRPSPSPLALFVAASLTLGLSLAASRPRIAHAVRQWPCLVLALIGGVWWLWLRPPAIGALAGLAGLIATAWLAWMRWRPRHLTLRTPNP